MRSPRAFGLWQEALSGEGHDGAGSVELSVSIGDITCRKRIERLLPIEQEAKLWAQELPRQKQPKRGQPQRQRAIGTSS